MRLTPAHRAPRLAPAPRARARRARALPPRAATGPPRPVAAAAAATLEAAESEPFTLTPLDASTGRRLQVQTVPRLAADTTALRCLDWDRDRFDIEFALSNGTTYNSYLIVGPDGVALVDASHEKFRDAYLPALRAALAAATGKDDASIDYVVVSHTEPDHSGLVADVLDVWPGATVVASKVALTYLSAMVHRPFASRAVKTGETLDLGGGHVLSFVNAPNLHWPDTMFTHDAATNVLYTCDAFGAHFCSTDPHDTDEAGLVPHFSLYYDCLMRPNARSVTTALRKVAELKVATVATGHGPVLTRHIDGWVGRYGAWSAKAGAAAATVVLLHAGDYGASERLSLATARGLAKSGDVAVEQFDAATADAQELASAVSRAAGVVVFAPPSDCPDSATSLATLVSSLKPGTRTLVAESYGGRDEPVDTLVASLVDAGAPPLIDALRVRSDPDDATAQRFEQAGTNLAKALTCKEAAARVKAAMGSDLAKALARVSGGLYVVTAARAGGGGASGAMVASWVAQAAFEPLAVTVAVAKDRAIESLLRVGDAFVLNVLSEDGAPATMKHFLQRFPPGADRFAGVDWAPAAGCGAPVLAAAVAHCECAVVSRLETPDHYVVLAHVVEGGVADPNALTSVHRRKVATYY